ncbi:MAG: sulfatase-like hydrolase/transferase [Anaerolineaceae bacterium]|nr:sulfatase-like hydrolase/transferase [Anaerolineaceae bacterium]
MAAPNVIVFFTDQQRWDSTGAHGNPLDLTPNFDRVAREGTHVSRSFTCQPVCGPARSVLQTGRYATETGCFRNGIALPQDAQTLAHHFREGGYTTGYIGKWHLADAGPGPVPVEQRGGYEYWLASNALEFTSDAYDTVLYDGEDRPVKLPGYRVDALTDAAIRYIDSPRNQPYFLFVSYIEPHHQNHRDDYPAPTGYEERYRGRWAPPDLQALGGSSWRHLAGYWGMVRRLDEALGRLIDALKSLGQLDNTILLFTSDHGNHFRTRNAEYKRSVHDSSLRVPTVLSGPGFDGGGHLAQLVSLIDLPPTLLDAAGLPVPEKMQGRSFLPLVHGQNGDWPDDMFFQVSESCVARGVRTQRWKYGVLARDRDGNRDSAADRYTETWLYDLLADPEELHNVVDLESHAVVRTVLRERLLRRMAQAGEAPPEILSPGTLRQAQQLKVSDAEARS